MTSTANAEPAGRLSAILDAVRRSLRRSARVRRNLPDGGRLFFDRPTPFLCVYRMSASEPLGDASLATTQAAFLVAANRANQARQACQELAEELTHRFGAFLIVELWPAPTNRRRRVIVYAPPQHIEDPLLTTARQALKDIRLGADEADVRIVATESPTPPRRPPLLDPEQCERLNTLLIGIEYPVVFRAGETTYLPVELRMFRRRLGAALQKIFFEFAKGRDPKLAATHEALASRGVPQAAAAVDRRLAEVSSSFDFLLHATPVDTEERWEAFRLGHFSKEPVFSYRPLPFEPRELKRLLYAAPIERVEDPLLWDLFAHKQDELDRQITLLTDRGSPRFRYGAIQIYGGRDDALLHLARQILDRTEPKRRGSKKGAHPGIGAPEVKRRAEAEIAYYRAKDSRFEARVEVRDDIAAAMMVSQNRLLISSSLELRAGRIEALLHHEIGTHLLTWFNGGVQPLRLLQDGAAGYEPTQEGLAVLAEYFCGGLTQSRLRTLAARVEAVHCLVDGAGFVDTFENLRKNREFSPQTAFRMTARVFRSGGLTKDAAYLRGLRDVLAALGKGREIEPLLVGKVALRNAPALRALSRRDIVQAPAILPRYFESADARRRMESCKGLTVLDLLPEVIQ